MISASDLVIERRADRIVRSLKRGAGHTAVVAAFAAVGRELGADAENRVADLVLHKLSRELPQRRRNRRHRS
jgi:hypothetical protein